MSKSRSTRNKDIRLLQTLTQDPYSVCRARMKRNNWNICDAILEGSALAKVASATREVIDTFSKSLRPAIEKIVECSKSLMKMLEDEQAVDEPTPSIRKESDDPLQS